jgi:hypothetical protein
MDNSKQVARFLEMTTFGPKKSEIQQLDNANWGPNARAQHLRNQIDLPATSHREHWRQRTNSKWDATAQPARSDHPCDPNSKWRKYAYTRQDYRDTITSQYIYTYFETVPEEADLTYTIYEADANATDGVSNYNSGTFMSSLCSEGDSCYTTNSGYSGQGFYDFGGTGDFLEFTVDIAEADAGIHPLSFRFAQDSSSNRPCQLWVNNVMVQAVYDFLHTDSWSYWKYSELVDVTLNAGLNTIKLIAVDQNSGPNIDHARIGKPPAIVMKSELFIVCLVIISFS